MRLPDIAALAFTGLGDTIARIKRDVAIYATCYAICGACLIVAVVMATSAGLMALDLVVGPIYARLIVAGVFIVLALGALLAVRLAGRRQKPVPAASPLGARAEQPASGKPAFSQIAMIVEAVMLGYSLSRRDKR